jgi:CRISPR-associated endonuclease/helicase Cas3
MDTGEFGIQFERLTGNQPLSWQRRLFDEFKKGADHLPSVIDLPTGLGKTMVMAIWLIARAKGYDVPTRLIYVVDRRTVVDQATDLATQLRDRYGKDKLAISTLRGQLADNREWSIDPSHPAIIIGTVDLIGSALLFSGYRSSYKRRPLEAGLLGQDSLLVLDEAHLSRPFEKLICAINAEGVYQKDRNGKPCGTPMRVIRMSATTAGASASTNCFKLEESDLTNKIIEERFNAKKRLTIESPLEKNKLNEALKSAAVALAQSATHKGKRIVVFVRSPDAATTIAELIRKYDATKSKPGSYTDAVEALTGTMRGLERDGLLEKPVLKRFLDSDENPDTGNNGKPVFLIATSAGEVGFDLNADHLVCDAATLDSMIQRLGRVNRRGKGDAVVRVFVEKDAKAEKPLDKAIANATTLFRELEQIGTEPRSDIELPVYSASPAAIKALKTKESVKFKLADASTPAPAMVELTDILLDVWSMTSIVEPMPGRSEVAPWLRGIDEELPQTTIAWRAELDLPGFDRLDLEDIEEWFDTHRVFTHETLSVPTSTAAKWFTDRWDKLDDKQKSDIGGRSIVVDRAGLKLVTVNAVIYQLGRKNTDSIRNSDLILPASFGGIERGKGLLNADAPQIPKDEEKLPFEEQKAAQEGRLIAPDVADIAPGRQRLREVLTKPEDGEQDRRSIGSGTEPAKSSRFIVELESDDNRRVQLFSYVTKFEKPETGSEPQSLEKHVSRVRDYANDIIRRLELKPDDPIRQALEFAADWHDHGKNREFFQRTVGGTPSQGGRPWPEQTRGKSGGKEFGKAPRGYRHEFGSLREFIDFHRCKLEPDVFDLAMHLIAVHHGRGRPHFPKGGFDPNCEARSDEIHTESIRRFAKLQRKYGWWHLAWLENLLRCADAMASSEQGPARGAK